MNLIDIAIIGIGGGILAVGLQKVGAPNKFIVIACAVFGLINGVYAGLLHHFGM